MDCVYVCMCDHVHVYVFAGPIIRAEVGEQIIIIFKNLASRPYNIYAHGVGTVQQTAVQPGPWSTDMETTANCSSHVRRNEGM